MGARFHSSSGRSPISGDGGLHAFFLPKPSASIRTRSGRFRFVGGGGHRPRHAALDSRSDASAPAKPNVLKQSGSGTFPWCVRLKTSIEDGFVEVKFKALAGDRGSGGRGGLARKDGDNYYVARAMRWRTTYRFNYTEAGHAAP